MCTADSLAETSQPPPPLPPSIWAHTRGCYCLLVSRDRRHLFVTPLGSPLFVRYNAIRWSQAQIRKAPSQNIFQCRFGVGIVLFSEPYPRLCMHCGGMGVLDPYIKHQLSTYVYTICDIISEPTTSTLPIPTKEPRKHTVHMCLEYHSICPLVRIGTPYPLSCKRVFTPSLAPKEGVHLPAGEGVGESQFGRLEKKPGTISTLCQEGSGHQTEIHIEIP